ncbi:hypothetical protein TRFO_37974 [Tritrichomonas foetus]|uniref:Uncharacterized protein n=1 Tax=Tritrichomonas foetus TaxID=1144522 RepID=A0A1J4J9S5_9EUKA|nr:hypothetical protein TRFO_37974 [Tritrichomonas foetus]|eukprot:OHS95904.1 hypothetical protein TRFO_37974 [Tritrichomonas foetus]
MKAEAKNTKISLEKEINELKNEAAIKDITLKSLSYDESKKNDFIHDISRLLQPFKQTFFADASSSEPLESEASFSEEEYGYSEVERPSRTKHEKQSENRPEMTLDEISDCTSRLIEQLEQLQTDNNVLSATREENMNKISNLTNSVRVSDVNMLGLSHERDVLTSLLLDQNEEEEEEEEEEEYTEAQEEIDFDLTDEMMSSEDASHLVHALKKLRNNKSDLESRLSKHKRQSKFLRKQLATLNNAKSAYEKELAQMQDKIKSLQDENFDKQKILTAMIEERQSIREGIVQSLADTIQDSIQNSSELSAPVIDQLHEISNELAKQQQKYHEQINSLEKKRIYDLEHEIELLKKQLEGIDEDIFPITERGILLDLCEEEEEAQDKDPKSRIKRLVNRLKERNEKLNEQIKQLNSQNEELLHEKETVLAAFGLSSNADKAEEDLHEEITSPIFQHVQSLKQEVADRCNEIETLKGLLSSSKSIIQKLTEERSDLLKALYPDANNEEINNEEEEEEEAKDKDALDESLMGNLNNLVSKITENSELMSNTITEGQESNTEPLQLSPRRKAKVAPQRPQAAITDVLKNLREQFNELTKTNVDLQAKYDDLLAEKETILNALGINVGEEEKHESLIFIFINKMKEQLNENCHEIAKLKELLENSTQTIQQLNQERDAILETLNGNIFEVQDDDNSILIDNLSSLDTKINKQSENMNNAIVEPVVPSEGTIPPIPPRSPRKIPPKPTNAIAESLKKLQTELREAMVSVVEKETEVEELKNELNEIHEDIISTMSSLNIPTEEHSTEEEQSTLSLKLKGIHEKLIERFNSFNNQLNEQNDEIAKQKEELTQKTEELTELQTEREAIRQALGLDQENCEEEVIQDIDSPIYNKIQDMKTEIFTLQDELSKIRQLLAKTTKTAQQLSQERESILQALYGNASNTEADNQSQLMENLEYLNSQIGQQSLNMSAAIEEPVEPSVGGVPSTPSHTLMPRSPRPQSAIVAALNKLRNDLKESIQSNLDKDALLDEMKIDLQALSSELSLGLEIEHVDEEEDESNALPLDEQLRKARSAILKKLEALEGDKQEINDKLIELETISQQKDEQLQELQQEKQQKDDQIHTLEEEKQEFIQQISAHELNEQTLSSEKDRLTTEYEELTQKFNELNESVNAAKALLGQAPEETTLSNQLMNFITHSAQEQSAQVSQLESEISSLKKEIERLQEENKALIAEKNAVLGVLGIKNQSGSDQEDDTFIDIESPLFNEVQNMTQKVEDQVHQINLLKTNLETAARTIQQLNQERMSIMNALLPGAPSDSTTKATASLFNSLESLGVQISKQNDEITNAINSSADDESLTSPKSPSTRPRTPRTSVRPQNMIVAALENIRKQLNLALEESSEKDVNIAELENELDAKEQRISELEKELVSIAATLGLEMNEKEKEDILNTVSKIKSEIQRLKSEAESCQSQLHNMKQI